MGDKFEALDEGILMASMDCRYTRFGFNLVSVQVCLPPAADLLAKNADLKGLVVPRMQRYTELKLTLSVLRPFSTHICSEVRTRLCIPCYNTVILVSYSVPLVYINFCDLDALRYGKLLLQIVPDSKFT